MRTCNLFGILILESWQNKSYCFELQKHRKWARNKRKKANHVEGSTSLQRTFSLYFLTSRLYGMINNLLSPGLWYENKIGHESRHLALILSLN